MDLGKMVFQILHGKLITPVPVVYPVVYACSSVVVVLVITIAVAILLSALIILPYQFGSRLYLLFRADSQRSLVIVYYRYLLLLYCIFFFCTTFCHRLH